MIELLQKWAELEPERCQFYDERDITLAFPGFNELAVFPKMLKIPQIQAIICGMIEAAIVERKGWWFICESPQALADGPGDWRVRIFINSQNDEWCVSYGATKLEALLNVYIEALEAMND